jgi:soluble lytic murein transglycosylase-like protein
MACALFLTGVSNCGPQTAQPLSPATANRIAQWNGFITEAAHRFAIPDAWIRGVMAQESAGYTLWNGKPITSAKGAMGLMQLMPGTWADLRARLGLGSDPYDPHDNILAGAAYLRDMTDRFGAGAFAAYNAGSGRYSAYLEGRQSLPGETKTYLAKLAPNASLSLQAAQLDSLFFVNSVLPLWPSVVPRTVQSIADPSANARDLFVPLPGASR